MSLANSAWWARTLGEGETVVSQLVVVAVVGLFAVLVVPAALAGQPTIERFPFEDHVIHNEDNTISERTSYGNDPAHRPG